MVRWFEADAPKKILFISRRTMPASASSIITRVGVAPMRPSAICPLPVVRRKPVMQSRRYSWTSCSLPTGAVPETDWALTSQGTAALDGTPQGDLSCTADRLPAASLTAAEAAPRDPGLD